jgi:hypothetical protein
VRFGEVQSLVIMVPVSDKMLKCDWMVYLWSDRWIDVEFAHKLHFDRLHMPRQHTPHTGLLRV